MQREPIAKTHLKSYEISTNIEVYLPCLAMLADDVSCSPHVKMDRCF